MQPKNGFLPYKFPTGFKEGVDFSYSVKGIHFIQVKQTTTMSLGADLQLKLSRRYEPSSLVHFHFRGKDVAVQTDAEGNPMVAFIGKRDEAGRIRGQRYSRTLKADASGRVVKDHWDLKGKA